MTSYTIHSIKNGVDKQKKIALNSNSYELSEEYIDLLIESEKTSTTKIFYLGLIFHRRLVYCTYSIKYAEVMELVYMYA